MTDNRQAIAAKINALLSKTVDNGATEEEAMSAMAKATELMAKYEVNMTEAQLLAEEIGQIEIVWGNNVVYNNAAWGLCSAIAALTETRAWKSSQPARVVFFGFKKDIQFAKWLYENLSTWCSNEADKWWRSPLNYIPSSQITGGERSKLKVSFSKGATTRISARMFAEVASRKKERNVQQSNGTALMVIDEVKSKTINAKLAHMKFRRASSGRKSYDERARDAGDAAGNNARWDKPINGTGSTLRLK